MKYVFLLIIHLIILQTNSRHSGFEKSTDALFNEFTEFSNIYQQCFSKIIPDITEIIANGRFNFLNQNKFVNDLNGLVFSLNDKKESMYGHLKALLQESVTISSQCSTFDLSLEGDYVNLIKFIVNLQANEMSDTMLTLFKQFIGYKNVFFFTIGEVRIDIRHLIINTINMFDIIETLMSRLMVERGKEEYVQLTGPKLMGYPYMLGFLEQLAAYDQTQERVMEKIEMGFVTLQGSLVDFDDALEALEFYYKQRYVRGVDDGTITEQLQEIMNDKKESDQQIIQPGKKTYKVKKSVEIETSTEIIGDKGNEEPEIINSEDPVDDVPQNQKEPELVEIVTLVTKKKDVKSHSTEVSMPEPSEIFSDMEEPELLPSKSTRNVHVKKKRSFEDFDEINADPKNDNDKQPIKICDRVILGNYGLNGNSIAYEVDSTLRLSPCENIEQACCDQQEMSRALESFQNTQLLILEQNYAHVSALLSSLLENYSKYNKLGYYFLKNEGTSTECRQFAKQVIFTPIARDYINRFHKNMQKAQAFSKRSKANIICWVCDYSFQKQMLEKSEIVLGREFCSSMMGSYYKFLLEYHMQLIDYFNDVVSLLQCSRSEGTFEEQFAPKLSASDRINNILLKCAENKKYCVDFCEEFSFTSVKSSLELDTVSISAVYYWVAGKLRELGETVDLEVEENEFGLFETKYVVERSHQLANRSISNLSMRFVEEDPESVVVNPDSDGLFILEVLDRNNQVTEV